MLDEQKLTERSEDYVILLKEELHLKQQKGTKHELWYQRMKEPSYWYLDQMKEGSFSDRKENFKMISCSIRNVLVFVKIQF